MNPVSEQFYQRFLAYQRANPGMVHVVRKGEDDEAVQAWFTYFTVKGQTGTIQLFRQLLDDKKAVQFPCRLPIHFEPSYVAPVHSWRDPSTGEVSRGDVSRVVQGTLASLRSAVPKGRPPVPKAHLAEPVKSPAEWLNDYQDNPPPIPVLSDEARAKFTRRAAE